MKAVYAFLAFLALILVGVSGLGALLAPTAPMTVAFGACAVTFFGCMVWAAGQIDG